MRQFQRGNFFGWEGFFIVPVPFGDARSGDGYKLGQSLVARLRSCVGERIIATDGSHDNRANDVNDNGDELFVSLTETERQELLQRNHEFEREQQQLLQEQAQLLLEIQHHMQDAADARIVRLERRQQLPQARAFETHILAQQQQQQFELVEEDAEEGIDTVSLSVVKPNP